MFVGTDPRVDEVVLTGPRRMVDVVTCCRGGTRDEAGNTPREPWERLVGTELREDEMVLTWSRAMVESWGRAGTGALSEDDRRTCGCVEDEAGGSSVVLSTKITTTTLTHLEPKM